MLCMVVVVRLLMRMMMLMLLWRRDALMHHGASHDDRYRSINQSMSQYGTPPSSLVVVTVARTRE